MTGAEKQILYKFLKTASDYANGFSSQDFPEKMPDFSDDEEQASQKNDIPCGKQAAENAGTGIQSPSGEIPVQPSALEAAENSDSDSVSISSVAKKIAGCRRCILCQTRTNTVPGEGVLSPAVLVIGEGPGADEDATGRPFVGQAGKLLDKMLASISLDRKKNCFIANIVKCRPPHNRDPQPEEAEACSDFLQAQIALLKPAMILCMGRIASQSLLKTETGINRLRGKFYEIQDIPALCTYHPSALLRNADLKRPAWEDLKMFRAKLEQLVPDYDRQSGIFIPEKN